MGGDGLLDLQTHSYSNRIRGSTHTEKQLDSYQSRLPARGAAGPGEGRARAQGRGRGAAAREAGAGSVRAAPAPARGRVRAGFCAGSPGSSHGLQPPPLPCLLSSRVLISLRWHGGGGGGGGARGGGGGGGGGGGEQLIIVMVAEAAAAAAAAAWPSGSGCSPRGASPRTSAIYFRGRLGLSMCLLAPARGLEV
nr:uncharacterized protein LOC110549420 [Meriones unguiculatus]